MMFRLIFGGLALGACFAVLGCGEKGRARASANELVGIYETDSRSGKERLTLRSDKTFTQVLSSSGKQYTTQGEWNLSNDFLGPTEIELIGSFAWEDAPVVDTRNLIVHRENGKLRLALSEAADWYYDRVD